MCRRQARGKGSRRCKGRSHEPGVRGSTRPRTRRSGTPRSLTSTSTARWRSCAPGAWRIPGPRRGRVQDLGPEDDWFVVAGLDEVAHLLEGVEVEARAVPEGTICRPNEPVLTLSGPYGAFAEHETAILGFLCQASGVATGAARCRLAAGEKRVISFGAQEDASCDHADDRAGRIPGRLRRGRRRAGRQAPGIPATGTIPHALVLILGSTAEAARAFDEVVDPEVPRTILIDTFDDEKFGALIAARAIPDSIYAVRLRHPGQPPRRLQGPYEEVRGSSTATASSTSRSSPRAA